MKIAVVIPTLNAVKRGLWTQVLEAIAAQTVQLEQKIVIDSASDDKTCIIAESYGWECWKIQRKDFNHGSTRDWAIRELAKNGIDTIVFLSQDVILATPESLSSLTGFLWNNPIAGCYGKQRSLCENTLNAWQRLQCYPEKSTIKTSDNLHQDGLMAVFFSNAFSAWKTAEVIRYGGFQETDFGEDMLLAEDVLKHGGAVGYCAEATVIHEHPNTPLSLFIRGFQIGAFHRKHPELVRKIGEKIARIPVNIPCALFLPLGIKLAGYAIGRIGEKLIPFGIFLLMWLLLLPAIFLYDFPQRDVANRYAPMAEALAQGDWRYAFHPRVTPLLTTCAGIVSFLLACNGYLACQIASSMFLTLAVFPLYSICKKKYETKIAFVTCILYALCPPFLRLGYFGLRETGSILGIVLLFYAMSALFEKHDRLFGVLVFAFAEAILLLSRGDVALFACIAALALLIWDIFRHHVPWRSLVAGSMVFIMLLPQLLYSYWAIGYPVPEVRHAVILRKICEKCPVLKKLENPHPTMTLDIGGGSSHE